MKPNTITNLQETLEEAGNRLVRLAGELMTNDNDTVEWFADRGNRNTFEYDIKLAEKKIQHFCHVLEQVRRYRG